MHERIVLCVDFDYFYAQAEELRKPELKGKPVIVCMYSGRTPTSGAVAAANYVARRELGIKAGIPIFRAISLAKERKDAAFLAADIPHYRKISDRIMKGLDEASDSFEQAGIDEAYMEVTEKVGGDWEAAERLAKRLKDEIKKREGLTCTVGIGPNKVIAKMASQIQKPDGLTVVTLENFRKIFWPKPVKELFGVGPKTVEALEKMGIKTIRELAHADTDKLAKLLGPNRAKTFVDSANGIDEEPVEPREATQISRIGTLKENSRSLEPIWEQAEKLCEEAHARLLKKKLKFRTVSIIVTTTDLQTLTRATTAEEPTSSLEAVKEQSRELLKQFLRDNPSAVLRRVGIRLANLS
jgi:DNA polymerase IV (DinB-like DNA polymerase)